MLRTRGNTKEGLGPHVAILVILVLVGLWAAVLVPPILRSRNSSGIGGVSDFMDSLRLLGGRQHGARRDLGGPVLHGVVGAEPSSVARGPRAPIAPPMAYRPMPGGVSPMQRRRRNVLTALAGAVGITFLFAVIARSAIFWGLFLLALACLGAYVYLLLQFKQRSVARYGPHKRVFATPIDLEEDTPRVGDNVILLRRNAG